VCVTALRTFYNSVDDTKQLDSKARAKISKACDPAFNPKVTHAYDDVVDGNNSGGQTVTGNAMHAERLGVSCDVGVFAPLGYGINYGLDGRFDSIDAWADCLLMAAEREALRQVHLQYPHGQAWLQDVTPMMGLLALSDVKAQDALDILPNYLRWLDYGTEVYDRVTGLWWEKKTDDGGIHDKDNAYTWSTASPWGPTGTAFTTFLNTLNGGATGVGNCTSADGVSMGDTHCNWRLPTAAELQTILLEPYPCSTNPCIDQTVFGPTLSADYWSATTKDGVPHFAWIVASYSGKVHLGDKGGGCRVRAVRGGF
jgi:hypothetical protein